MKQLLKQNANEHNQNFLSRFVVFSLLIYQNQKIEITKIFKTFLIKNNKLIYVNLKIDYFPGIKVNHLQPAHIIHNTELVF